MKVPRLRRINDVLAEIKQQDPDTIINWKIIHHLIITGEIRTMKMGNSWLINKDELFIYFTKKGVVKNEKKIMDLRRNIPTVPKSR